MELCVRERDPFHAVNFNFNIVAIRKTIGDFINCILVNLAREKEEQFNLELGLSSPHQELKVKGHLHAMNYETRTSVELLVTRVASGLENWKLN